MPAAEGASRGLRDAKYHLMLLTSVPGRPLTPEAVQLHAAHLAQLDRDGQLVLAGPLPERPGGLIVLRAGSLTEARAVAEDDPLVKGQFQTYEVATWLMSDRDNNYRPNL
jgi:uncharacterized protein YciI